jgi:hypothetical protein
MISLSKLGLLTGRENNICLILAKLSNSFSVWGSWNKLVRLLSNQKLLLLAIGIKLFSAWYQ